MAEVALGNGLICTWMNNARTHSAVQGGVANPAWGEQIQPGDEIREYCSPLWTWGSLCGREGIVIVRDGKVIGGMITRVS